MSAKFSKSVSIKRKLEDLSATEKSEKKLKSASPELQVIDPQMFFKMSKQQAVFNFIVSNY